MVITFTPQQLQYLASLSQGLKDAVWYGDGLEAGPLLIRDTNLDGIVGQFTQEEGAWLLEWFA